MPHEALTPPAPHPIGTIGDLTQQATGPRAGRDGLPRPVMAGAAVAGLVLRIAVMAGPLGRPNADEVLTALMARHIPSDGFPAFVWGQHYGGTAELLPVAASLRVFGWSTVSLRLPNLVLAVLIAVLVWRLADRVLPRRWAQLAGLLAWVFPGTALWFGLREQLFYPLTVALGLALVLLADRIGRDRRPGDVVGFGLVLGVAFWTSPFFVEFAVPAGVVLVAGLLAGARPRPRRSEVVAGVALAGGAALVGAFPWVLDNLRTGGASLHAGDAFPVVGTYPSRLGAFFTDALPGVLGLRQTFTLRWVGGPFGLLVSLGILIALGAGVVLAARQWRRDRVVPWDAVGLVTFPLVFAAFPFVTNDPIFRYAYFVVPFALVVGVRAAASIAVPDRRRNLVPIGVLVAGIGLSALTLQQLYVVAEVDHAAGIGTVDLAPTRQVLDDRGIDAVFADYWISYRVSFETEERIVGSSTSGADRDPAADATARASSRSAWVVVPGRQQDALVGFLDEHRIGAEVIPAGDLTVVVPARPVLPDEVPSAARSGS